MVDPTSAAHSGASGKSATGCAPAGARADKGNWLARLLLICLLAFTVPAAAAADPIRIDVDVDTSGGYARLVFTSGEDVDTSVRVAGDVLIISFTKPVLIATERLIAQAPDYIAAARPDPDGKAIRLALARKVRVNSIPAAERFFVDLLPEPWSGAPPGLPPQVVAELARRARDAERLERLAQQSARQQRKIEQVRVRVARQPTFMRYVFDVSAQTTVSADRGQERLTLSFDAPIKFDLADVEAALPAAIAEVNAETEENSTLVRFAFLAKVDVRTFHDGASYVVDIIGADTQPVQSGAAVENDPQGAASEGSAVAKAAGDGGGPAAPEAPDAIKLPTEPSAPAASTPPPNGAAPPTAATKPATAAQAPAAQSAAAKSAAATSVMPSEPVAASPAPSAVAAGATKGEGIATAPPPPAAVLAPSSPAAKAAGDSAGRLAAATTKPSAAPVAPAASTSLPSGAALPAAATKSATATPVPAAQPAAAKGAAAASAAPATPATPTVPAKPAAPALKSGAAAADVAKGEGMAMAPPAATSTPAAATVPAPAAVPTGAAAPPAAAARDGKATDKIGVDVSRQGDDLKLSFAFTTPTAAAVFQRADTLWIVFDATVAIDLSALAAEAGGTVRDVAFTRAPDADIVRIRLDRPHLASVAIDGAAWSVTIGDTIADPGRALDVVHDMIGPNRSSVTIPLAQPHRLHRVDDPEIGDQLLVVTAFGPPRGFINTLDFLEFHALASSHGVVIEPLADDIDVALDADKVVVSRPGGLALSSSVQRLLGERGPHATMFEPRRWGGNREATFAERQAHLISAAASAPADKRYAPRLDLARFYVARAMYPEAKGVLDVALAERLPAAADMTAKLLRAVAEVMMNRPDAALKDLADPAIGDQHDAPLWRALAHARQGKWSQARAGFKSAEASIAGLPVELQRVVLKDELRAAIEVGDLADAANELNDLDTIGVPRALQPAISVLGGRLSEGMGRTDEALAAYRAAADSWDRPAAAQGRLRETVLRYSLGELKRQDAVAELETLTAVWRGDETEIEALQVLARLYTEEGRYRDSFYVMRSAMAAHPDWDMTRRIQEEAGKTFEALFLDGKGDRLPAIEALALFYDFRDLTPIDRRGDEMIRRLADRLVSVDLLEQAAELLQYQVDHRLQGAARAEVATRLAVIYLMNRKPDHALATLQATRTGDLSTELRNKRLLLEARALSDLGRHDVALEVCAHVAGPAAIRLRSDILWAARRWSKAAEQIELLHGERWKDWQPLNAVERADILRAAIGYALDEDALGLGRLRERYAAQMAQTPDAHAFAVVSAPLGTSGAEFRDIAHAAAAGDTLTSFLRDMQARYPQPDVAAPAPSAAPAAPAPAATLTGQRASVSAPAPQTRPAPSPPRANARTAQG